MYNIDEIVEFIEKKNNIKLMTYQIEMLYYMLNGCYISFPKRYGKSILQNGFKDYLKTKYDKGELI